MYNLSEVYHVNVLYMRRRDIVLVSSLLAILVVGMFVYTYLERGSLPAVVPVVEAPTVPVDRYGIKQIEGKHFYLDGVHTVVGELIMPTPCDLLEYNAVVAESMPEQVTLAFSVINNDDSCANLATPQRFLLTATASEMASFQATFMGQPVELNLIEAAANETPESFELYIKG